MTTPTAAPARKPDFAAMDFNRSPFLVIWEVTQACSLACRHCRAEAQPCRDSGELTTAEGKALLDETRKFGPVLFVITGGDPLERPDIFELIRYGADIGLRMTMTPAGTAMMTRERVAQMKEAGLARLAVSLDGPDRESHDSFRRVDGSFGWTMDSIRFAREIGLEVQINTTVTRFNRDRLAEIAELLAAEDIALWSVFFLVPVGRGLQNDMISPKEHEAIFHQLVDLSREMPYDIKTTAAQHYRRVLMQRIAHEKMKGTGFEKTKSPASALGAPGFTAAAGRAAKGVNDGQGFVFISHLGEVMPSGFLPISAGNVRAQSLVELYRESEIFQALRDPAGYKGKCGYCDFNDICGGSRSRAWSAGGNHLGSEPYCTYRPQRPGSEKKASNTYRDGPHAEASSLTREEVLAALRG